MYFVCKILDKVWFLFLRWYIDKLYDIFDICVYKIIYEFKILKVKGILNIVVIRFIIILGFI